MKNLGYNLALFFANTLFAFNFSLFVSILESDSLAIGSIYLLQCLVTFALLLLWRSMDYCRGRSFTVRGKVNLRDGLAIWGISTLSSLGWSFAVLWGMSLTSPIDAATIASAGPSLTLILAHFMRRRQLTPTRLSGVALSLCGVAIALVGRGVNLFVGGEMWGNIILVIAMCIAAINTLILGPLLNRYGIRSVAWRYSIAALVPSILIFGAELDLSLLSTFNPLTLSEVILLLLLGGALPLLLLFEGTEYLSPLHTSLYRYLQPFVTSLVVVLRGQATLTIYNYMALLAIVAGCVLVAKGVDQSG